jgi:SAM-dependent methyltransferase
MTYLFDHAGKQERERLATMQAGGDPATIQCLESLGVDEGWRCLEVGAGLGSIAGWLCRRVGSSGHVVATDLETKFLEAIDAPNLEVRQHDIGADDLEESAFDLVHARKVLEHMPNPDPPLARMAAALRPGGWLVVEDADLVSLNHVSGIDRVWFRRGHGAFIEALSSAGYNPELGIHLGDKLRALGLTQVDLRGAGGEWSGRARPADATASREDEGPSVFVMTFERVRERIVEMGLLSAEEADRFLEDIRAPEFRAMTALHFIAWGRKPSG